MEFFKLIIENPSGWVLILSGAGLVFYFGITYSTMLNIKKRMEELVTKKDLEIEFSKFRKELEDAFVTTKVCDNIHRANASIPIDEHVRLMTQQEMGLKRLDVLEREVQDLRLRHDERTKG